MARLRISTQPISMMRSPSLALRPVVSVSRTICLSTWNAFVGETVRPFVLDVSGVALHPVPLDVVLRRQLVELAPQVGVLHRLLVGGAPAAPLPVVDPQRDALLHVLRIGVQAHP